MWKPFQMINYVTVDDMYKFSRLNNQPLLSNYNSPFWTEYRDNYARYDSLFRRMFKSFHYFDQESYGDPDNKDEAVETVTPEFINQVYDHLMMNDKRYNELWRIWSINDEEYSITTGYLYNETHTETGNESGTDVMGSREDSTQNTKGAQLNTETDSYGARSNTYTDEKGGHTDTDTTTDDAYNDTSTHQVQGFNSSEWQNADKTLNENGQQKQTKTSVYGSHTDTDSETLGAYEDLKTFNEGQRSDEEAFSKGEQTNTNDKEYNRTLTIERYGNVGSQSVTDILEKHERYWSRFNFYKMVFADICRELLLVN